MVLLFLTNLAGANPVSEWVRSSDSVLAYPEPRFWLQRERSTFLAKPLSAIDRGTGAGFPGVPLAIVYPDWTVTLLDSTRQKIDFLTTFITGFGLQNM